MGFPIGHRPNRPAIEGIFKKFQPQPEISAETCGKNGVRRETRSRFPPNFTKTTMARSTVQISAQFKKGMNHHIITQVLGQKYPNLGENGRPGGAPKWREKSKKLFFFHRCRLIKASTGLQIAPKSLSLVNTVPTDLPAKEFLKKLNPVLSYGPKRDGGSRPGSRRSSQFLTNFTKIGLEGLRGKISAQF